MENRKLNNLKWTVEDIYLFLHDDMESDQLSAFEKDIRQDPFLKDMVEGLAGHSPLHVEHHLQRIHQFLPSDSTERVISGKFISIAASLIILCFSIWWVVNNYGRLTESTTAESEPKVEEISQLPKESIQQELSLVDSNLQDSLGLMAQNQIDSARLAEEALDKNRMIARTYRRPRKPTGNGLISGAVVDADGRPLSGATVYFPENDASITTDFQGQFTIELKSFDTTAIVRYSGFEPGVFSLTSGDQFQFQLLEGITASLGVDVTNTLVTPSDSEDGVALMDKEQVAEELESKVSGFSARSERSAEATPEKGFRKYSKYIKRNLQYPKSAEENGIKGEVILQFKVLPDGELFDFRVIQSLGYGCDEEAIRLIREGPEWVINDDSQLGQATYSVRFE